MASLSSLLAKVRGCSICKSHLPHDPRPVLQLHSKAKILIAAQAPGRKVNDSGVPFDDASGNRLREWMGVSLEVFRDPAQIAIIPMGLCFPGTGRSGDLPPRRECAPAWRAQLLSRLRHLQFTLVIGQYAQAYHFGEESSSLTERVKAWRTYWPSVIPLPHPSGRNNLWLHRNRWFEAELLPSLKARVSEIIS